MSSKALASLGMRLSTSRSLNNTLFRVASVGGSSGWANRDLSTLVIPPRSSAATWKPSYYSGVFRSRSTAASEVPADGDKDAAVGGGSGGGEKATGDAVEHEFQAETRQLLDIVARSLYSEKEVFIRELISNASDAIEKFRYLQVTQSSEALTDPSRRSQIEVCTDKVQGTITIADNGIGMTREDMISNLGTIARSGSKAFVDELQQSKEKKDGAVGSQLSPEAIIGQFGVGFYSAFMVADKLEVYSLHSAPGSRAFHWSSDGSGKYAIGEAENVKAGTKVVVHLKPECLEFADENTVKEIIKKYSSFVGSRVLLNGSECNDLRPVWLTDPKEVDEETHAEFYRYVANAFDSPRFVHHFRIDTPMDIRALLYVPESRPGMFETSREGEAGVALYCRKVLIKSKTENVVPKWMRFVKGVVDSEDIPLNLSRELLQDSAQVRKIRTVITDKFLRFLGDKAKKERKSFLDFYKDYGFFFKEGILTSGEQREKEEIAKLLRFESSSEKAGEPVSLADYCARMRPGQREIYYMAAPSRQLAESSPYFEALRKKDVEVLFCYEAYDELVLMQLQQFDKKNLRSVEKEMREGAEDEEKKLDEGGDGEKEGEAAEQLSDWMKVQLAGKAKSVKVTRKLESHPCVVTVLEMAAARHFIKTQGSNFSEEQRFEILQPQFEINPGHPIIKKVNELRASNKQLAILVTEQLFLNAMVAAGLVEDPRTILRSMNSLLEAALEKH